VPDYRTNVLFVKKKLKGHEKIVFPVLGGGETWPGRFSLTEVGINDKKTAAQGSAQRIPY
jgi:hypothetical protein